MVVLVMLDTSKRLFVRLCSPLLADLLTGEIVEMQRYRWLIFLALIVTFLAFGQAEVEEDKEVEDTEEAEFVEAKPEVGILDNGAGFHRLSQIPEEKHPKLEQIKSAPANPKKITFPNLPPPPSQKVLPKPSLQKESPPAAAPPSSSGPVSKAADDKEDSKHPDPIKKMAPQPSAPPSPVPSVRESIMPLGDAKPVGPIVDPYALGSQNKLGYYEEFNYPTRLARQRAHSVNSAAVLTGTAGPSLLILTLVASMFL